MSTTTAARAATTPAFRYDTIARLTPAHSTAVERVTLGETQPTLPDVAKQLRALQQLAAPSDDAAKAAANHFRDLWAQALQNNPDGPTSPDHDHSRFLDPDYLKSISYRGHQLIVAGDANASYLPQMIGGTNGAKEMPPDGDLSDADREALLAAANDWIKQGAVNWDPLPQS